MTEGESSVPYLCETIECVGVSVGVINRDFSSPLYENLETDINKPTLKRCVASKGEWEKVVKVFLEAKEGSEEKCVLNYIISQYRSGFHRSEIAHMLVIWRYAKNEHMARDIVDGVIEKKVPYSTMESIVARKRASILKVTNSTIQSERAKKSWAAKRERGEVGITEENLVKMLEGSGMKRITKEEVIFVRQFKEDNPKVSYRILSSLVNDKFHGGKPVRGICFIKNIFRRKNNRFSATDM